MREQLNEVWFAVHTLREQDPDGLIYNRWDDVCGALSQIAENLGFDNFMAEEPTSGATFNHDIKQPNNPLEKGARIKGKGISGTLGCPFFIVLQTT